MQTIEKKGTDRTIMGMGWGGEHRFKIRFEEVSGGLGGLVAKLLSAFRIAPPSLRRLRFQVRIDHDTSIARKGTRDVLHRASKAAWTKSATEPFSTQDVNLYIMTCKPSARVAKQNIDIFGRTAGPPPCGRSEVTRPTSCGICRLTD